MTITPLRDRLVLQPRERDTRTQTGLFIPENASEANALGAIGRGYEGEVLAVGPDVQSDIRVGDCVSYRQAGGTRLRVSGSDGAVLVLAERDVLAVLARTEGELRCRMCGCIAAPAGV